MIEEFTKRWFFHNHIVREQFEKEIPNSYSDIVKAVVTMLHNEDKYDSPDPKRIHEIDDGDYQGTLVYVIGASGYQPYTYWYVKVSYGSCSGCDTLQDITSGQWMWDTEEEKLAGNKEMIDKLMTLALHIIQGLKQMGDEE